MSHNVCLSWGVCYEIQDMRNKIIWVLLAFVIKIVMYTMLYTQIDILYVTSTHKRY